MICGGRAEGPGFAVVDAQGTPTGFDVDLCRAIAAAVLGSPEAIQWQVLSFGGRGEALNSGVIDVLTMQTTWTTLRDAEWGDFAPTMFYDGQGFMVGLGQGITSLDDLRNATVCVTEGTTTIANLNDFVADNPAANITPMAFPTDTARNDAYVTGMCQAVTSDQSDLQTIRSAFANRDAHMVLPETISEEPLGPVVPHGDDVWADIVKTVMSILIYAEAYGITSMTVPTAPTGDVKVDRLFGLDSTFGQTSLGLSPTAAQTVIRTVGNYGEIYEQHLGSRGLGMQRAGGRNALWANAPCQACPKDGQIYAAPPQ